MSTFTRFSGELDLEYERATGRYIVLKEFRYYVGSETSGIYVNVPVGFDTDGASVPQFLWNILPPFGKYGQAAVVHDMLYRYGKYVVNGIEVDITRAQADSIFLESMRVLGVSSLVCTAMYWGVRAFGASSFKGVKK